MAAPKGNKFAVGKATGRPPTWTEDKIKEEADLLLKWAETDDAITLRKFAGLRGYSQQMLNGLAAKSEVFAEALNAARTLTGVRREEGALYGRLDAGIVRATLATYDEEHRAMLKEMRKAEAESNGEHAVKQLIEHLAKTSGASDSEKAK